MEKKQANSLIWSPSGTHLVIAGLGNLNGTLEFFDVNLLETMGTDEHYMASNVEWDPSGRYVASTVSFWRHQLDTGYNIYMFNARLLKKTVMEKFCQFLWRPRPPTPLSLEKLEV